MRFYFDDNITDPLLVRLFQQASHDVQLPIDVGLIGSEDPVHLTHAIRMGRAQLTFNCRDFEDLHDLVVQSGGHHPGILVVRKDNDPRRDLSVRGIVNSLNKLLAAVPDLTDQFVILNHWR